MKVYGGSEVQLHHLDLGTIYNVLTIASVIFKKPIKYINLLLYYINVVICIH
jgi:hypothetical protein